MRRIDRLLLEVKQATKTPVSIVTLIEKGWSVDGREFENLEQALSAAKGQVIIIDDLA